MRLLYWYGSRLEAITTDCEDVWVKRYGSFFHLWSPIRLLLPGPAGIQEAKRLLTHTDKPIKEIASLTGYQRLTSFITAFRKHFGYTPGSVRR